MLSGPLPDLSGQFAQRRRAKARSTLSAQQENDDHDHQQQAESAAEQMEWRPEVESTAAEYEDKQNQE
jgi:hypothetical protein